MTAFRSIDAVVEGSFDEVEPALRDALGAHGFGVLTEIDVAATLQAKLGVTRPPLKILGACNPSFADRALAIDPAVALVLPCNVVLRREGSATRVSIADPRSLIDAPALAGLAAEAAQGLEDALASLAGASSGGPPVR